MAGSKSTRQTELAGMAPAGLSGFNLKALDAFMQWVEEAGQTCELDEVGREITVAFILYRTRLKNYRNRIRNYWVQ